MKHKVWNLPPAVPIPEELIRAGYTPLLSAVLASRGVATAEAAAAFLKCGPDVLEDPFALKDMDKAVSRIRRARKQNETVAVYGDYDVDGITSACLLTEYLRGMGLSAQIYIPDRLEEGYGVNKTAVERLRERNVSLIITVDCGITAVEEADYAASLGMDMIITDHHECQEVLPRAAAVVDPKRPDGPGTGRDLAGVGVAFKLVCALEGGSGEPLARFADLLAVGTVADVMPLTGENRFFVRTGLEKLRRDPRPGFGALMEEAGAQPDRMNAMGVSFTLAPRINAAGRLGRPAHAAELLMERDPARAKVLAEELCGMNRERQRLEADIWRQAEEMLAGARPQGPIVLAGEGWHQGVIGIAASRIAEAYAAPAVMISLDGDRGKGSCRSYGGFNLFDALSACGEYLDAFGGHALAAGLNVSRENIPAFRAALADYYAAHPPREEEVFTPDVLIDSPVLLTMESVASLDALEPCGAGNPRPTFCLGDARLVSVSAIGGGRHTCLRLEKFGQVYDCVWFGRKATELPVSHGDRVDAVFFPQITEFRGRRSVQLLMQDLRRADVSALCRAILEGADPESLYLNRGELARIWRGLERLCPLRTDAGGLGRIDPRLHPAKIALGLRVLRELRLAAVTPEADAITITLRLRGQKADLMESAAWRRHHS